MFKRIATSASALALIAGLVACSPSDGGGTSETSETSAVSETSETSATSVADEKPAKPFDRPDLNGLIVSEACEKARAAGWRVDEVVETGGGERSHCGDSEAIVVKASYIDDWGGESIVDLFFANEEDSETAAE